MTGQLAPPTLRLAHSEVYFMPRLSSAMPGENYAAEFGNHPIPGD